MHIKSDPFTGTLLADGTLDVGIILRHPGVDPFTGVWVGNDPDGSVFRIMLGAPGADGTRSFTAFDSYATFCETSGTGSGSSLSAQGTATTIGATLSATITSFHCANGAPGAIPAPFPFTGTLLADGTLDVGIILTHPGSP